MWLPDIIHGFAEFYTNNLLTLETSEMKFRIYVKDN